MLLTKRSQIFIEAIWTKARKLSAVLSQRVATRLALSSLSKNRLRAGAWYEGLAGILASTKKRVWPGQGNCTALWVSPKGVALSYAAIWGVFARHPARFHIRPHDVRAAAGTAWTIFSPENIEVAQELLGHRDIRTTTTHYNRAR